MLIVVVNIVVLISKGPDRLAGCRLKICLGRTELTGTLTTETTAETILDVMSEQGHVYELSLKVKKRDDFNKTPCCGPKFITTTALAHSGTTYPESGSGSGILCIFDPWRGSGPG